jgi:hypothetical protein
MDKLSAFGTVLETTAETKNGASETTCKIDDKNRLEKQFISSQTFHRTPDGRVQKTTMGERFRPRILETFNPMAQEHTGFSLQQSTLNQRLDSSTNSSTILQNNVREQMSNPAHSWLKEVATTVGTIEATKRSKP